MAGSNRRTFMKVLGQGTAALGMVGLSQSALAQTGAAKRASGAKSTEERLAQLEAALEKANLEISRAQAAVEIQSVMGRYAFYYSAQRFDLIRTLWSKQEDATFDVGAAELVNKSEEFFGQSGVGLFRIHALSTPVVEVAKDGLTARSVWISPGISTTVDKGGKGSAKWCWIKYGCDFIKEDGQWKFWHVTAYGLFESDYYTSWADMEPQPLRRTMLPASREGQQAKQGQPATRHIMPTDRDNWTYAKDRVPVLEPVPPLPYNTWDEVGPGYRTW